MESAIPEYRTDRRPLCPRAVANMPRPIVCDVAVRVEAMRLHVQAERARGCSLADAKQGLRLRHFPLDPSLSPKLCLFCQTLRSIEAHGSRVRDAIGCACVEAVRFSTCLP